MDRRKFIVAGAIAAGGALSTSARANGKNGTNSGREYVQIETFFAPNEEKCQKLCEKLDAALISSLNQKGFEKAGVFCVRNDLHEGDKRFPEAYRNAVFVVFSTQIFDNLERLHEMWHTDRSFDAIQTGTADALFENQMSSLLRAFPGCPRLAVPTLDPERVLQLRCYASPTPNRNRAKRNMFDIRGELDLFRRCGMPPVFFGETLYGGIGAPSLHYMLSFENNEARVASWKKFVQSEEWIQMRDEPEFHDTATKVTNLFLRPSKHSQI
ncbi:MAG: NIPSNAP family protein [Planctomycetia bacterium]|nr:NIPSNAP family protein [Planctomycetia bacterium]